jgi:hypothetical protein
VAGCLDQAQDLSPSLRSSLVTAALREQQILSFFCDFVHFSIQFSRGDQSTWASWEWGLRAGKLQARPVPSVRSGPWAPNWLAKRRGL